MKIELGFVLLVARAASTAPSPPSLDAAPSPPSPQNHHVRASKAFSSPTRMAPSPPAGQCGGTLQNTDYDGGNLCNWPNCKTAASAEECCAICHSTPGCVAASLFQGTCYTKSDMSKPVTKSGCQAIPASQPGPTPPPPPPGPQNSHVRVSKALGSRGYNKVRVSLVRYSADGTESYLNSSASASVSDVSWSYQSQFQQRWAGNSIKSAIVDVTPGQSQSLQLDGITIDVKIPEENAGAIGTIPGDPCIHYDATWCQYADVFQVKDTWNRVINGLVEHDSLDYWVINGDVFYDQSGSISKEFMGGLSLKAQARLSAITLGNHDYWIAGSPGKKSAADSFGNGHMQFYAVDTVASKEDESKPFDFSKSADSQQETDIKNSFWYTKIGNTALIGFSNAYSWAESTPYLQDACNWVGNAKPSLLLLIGHWNGANDGCPNGMDDGTVYNRVKGFTGCSGIPFKYIEGHTHCNTNNGDGALLGANGFEGCGDFGIPIIDTRNTHVKLWYFEMGSGGQKNGNFDAIVRCLESNGLDACLHYATTWWDESLEAGFNSTAAQEGPVV